MRHIQNWGALIAFALVLGAQEISHRLGFAFPLGNWALVCGIGVWAALLLLFHLRAKRAVRKAGLPHQTRVETETVPRTATEFQGRLIRDNRFNEPLVNTFVGLFYFCLGAFFLAKGSETQNPVVAALYLIGIGFCFVAVIWYFLTRPLPTLRIDDRGVFGYKWRVWPRMVRWQNIEAVVIERSHYPLMDHKQLKLRLKNARGRSLLVLSLDSGWRGEKIVKEIKERLSGTAAINEMPSILPFPEI